MSFRYDDRFTGHDNLLALPPFDFQSTTRTLDDDFFFGARLTLNDVQDSELLAGFTVDRDDQASQLSLEASRRLDNHWSTELEGRWFLNSGERELLSAFKKDSYLSLRLFRYF